MEFFKTNTIVTIELCKVSVKKRQTKFYKYLKAQKNFKL